MQFDDKNRKLNKIVSSCIENVEHKFIKDKTVCRWSADETVFMYSNAIWHERS